MILTIALAVGLAGTPAPQLKTNMKPVHGAVIAAHIIVAPAPVAPRLAVPRLAIDLHPMTPDEKRLYPGRENWDKTEWYEAQFKSAKIVIHPEHVDEWHNGGLDVA